MLEELETEYRAIFDKTRITKADMMRAAIILCKWKLIVGYKTDRSNPVLDESYILDDEIVKQTKY